MRIVQQAQKLWEKATQSRNNDIRDVANEYRSLLDDPRYTKTQRALFEKKRAEKDIEIANISGNTAEEIGIKFIKLQAERNIYNNLLNAPDNFFKALRDIEKEKGVLTAGGETECQQ